jgi:hypothetical protein
MLAARIGLNALSGRKTDLWGKLWLLKKLNLSRLASLKIK